LLTGQRAGEVTHTRHEHVADGWGAMQGKPAAKIGWPGTKRGPTHRVWLPEEARAIIAELTTDDDETTGFVFAGERGKPIVNLDGAMRDICSSLGIEDKVTPHDLHRT